MIRIAKMEVLFTLGSLDLADGGPSRTVPSLCAALADTGVSGSIVACSSGEAAIENSAHAIRTHIVPYPSRFVRGVSGAAFERALARRVTESGATLVHDNGVWLRTNHAAASVARRMQLPLVVSPRGMLEPWSLRHHAWKKRVAWVGFQRRDLEHAAVIHATSDMEAANLRGLGLRAPIAVVPNGVALPDVSLDELWRDRIARPARTALFLSRVHPKKGLLDLVAAWSLVRPVGWRLVIAGPDEAGHRADVEAAVRRARLDDVIEFAGPVDGERRQALFRDASLFVLPTHSENFGVVVAEALSFGIPVITTRGAPWAALSADRCGWWTEIGPDALAAALRDATNVSAQQFAAMGARGRAYVERALSWPKAAMEMRGVYEWASRGGTAPRCMCFAPGRGA